MNIMANRQQIRLFALISNDFVHLNVARRSSIYSMLHFQIQIILCQLLSLFKWMSIINFDDDNDYHSDYHYYYYYLYNFVSWIVIYTRTMHTTHSHVDGRWRRCALTNFVWNKSDNHEIMIMMDATWIQYSEDGYKYICSFVHARHITSKALSKEFFLLLMKKLIYNARDAK